MLTKFRYYYLGHSPRVPALRFSWFYCVLRHLLPEGRKGLSPESVSCRAKTNQNLEDGLWALSRDRKKLEKGPCAWRVCGFRGCHRGQVKNTQRDRCSDRVMAASPLILSSLQEFLYRAAGELFYWIGLTKAGSEGQWYWVDNTPFDEVQSMK